jgi:hypothetical protein
MVDSPEIQHQRADGPPLPSLPSEFEIPFSDDSNGDLAEPASDLTELIAPNLTDLPTAG